MKLTQNNTALLGAAKHYTCQHFNRFPAFGKQLMQQRLAGQVPRNSVVVAFEWNLGRIFTRIVITDAVSPDTLELRYLAGLDVQIVYRDKDASRVIELAQAILRVNPRTLLAFGIDIPKNTILKNLAGENLI